jgi:DNA-binding MarR family transcriptional regulator
VDERVVERVSEQVSDAVYALGLEAGLYSDACAATVGLHPTDWRILDVLCTSGALTAGEVAGRLAVSNGAVTGAVDRLERVGAVRRVRDGVDRRKVRLEVVKDGDAQVAAAYGRLAAELAAVHAALGEEQLAVVRDYLGAAREAIARSTAAVRAGGGLR